MEEKAMLAQLALLDWEVVPNGHDPNYPISMADGRYRMGHDGGMYTTMAVRTKPYGNLSKYTFVDEPVPVGIATGRTQYCLQLQSGTTWYSFTDYDRVKLVKAAEND